MKTFIKNSLLMAGIVALLFSCKTNPPNAIIILPQEYGKIFVLANIDGAQIFLDATNTGRVTPDTIEATVGVHTIRLEKDSYSIISQNVQVIKDSVVEITFELVATVQKVVLLEDFANVSCFPCVNSNKIIESLTNYTYGHKKLVAIKYPTNWPSATDPFYLANSQACDLRISYYSIQIAPTTIIDGTKRPSSVDSISVKDSIDQQLSKDPRFSVIVKDSIAGSMYYASVKLKVLDGSGVDFSNIVLHTVVTETDIEFSEPPGANGETKFYDVMRVMLPTNSGESLNGISQTEEVTFQRQTAINSAWVTDKLNTVAFIQNVVTKEVYQAGSTFE